MSKSEHLYAAARELIPGGVNSPVRAFTGVGGTPLFIERADGAYLYDVWHAAIPIATKSSNSKAAITVTPTVCW